MSDDKIIERITRLLALAEHPNTPIHEAELALTQANKLITKHAIDEAILRMSQTTEQRRAPERRQIKLATGGAGGFISYLRTILHKIAETNRCSIALDWYDADVYGASEDVAWVEMLYMSVYFQMLSKINPNWDESKGYDENVYNFKVAGFKWIDINHESMRHGGPDARVWDGPFATEKIKGSMISAYKRHAKKIGDTNPVSTQSHKVYRMSFVFGFQQQMLYRLDRWFEQSQEQMDTIPGAALAITEFSEESRRMMYGDHPELDPELIRRRREEEKAARAEMLDRMTPKQRYEFLEKEQREARRQIKRIKYYTPDDSASSRGQHVANSIDLSRKAGSAHAGATRGELA